MPWWKTFQNLCWVWDPAEHSGKEQQRGILPQQEVMGLLGFSSKKKFLISLLYAGFVGLPLLKHITHFSTTSVFLHLLPQHWWVFCRVFISLNNSKSDALIISEHNTRKTSTSSCCHVMTTLKCSMAPLKFSQTTVHNCCIWVPLCISFDSDAQKELLETQSCSGSRKCKQSKSISL